MYSDAVIQTCVQHSLQALVQPRLDGLAERLAGVVAAAQGELRDLERLFERSEARIETRLASAEARLAVLGDGAARTEQRERELNTRIAGLAEGMLQRCGEEPATAAGAAAELADLDWRTRDADYRLEVVEASGREAAQRQRWLEHRLEDFEEPTARAPPKQEGARRASRLGDRLQGQSSEEDAGAAAAAVLHRVAALEEHVRSLEARGAEAEQAAASQLVALECRAERQLAEGGALATKLGECRRELEILAADAGRKQEEQREEVHAVVERQQACAARLDDMNLRLGALKIKVDSVEGRMSVICERTEASRRPWEAQMQQDLADRCQRVVGDFAPRLDVLERRLATFQDACEDVVEQTLERLLAPRGSAAASSAPPRAGPPSSLLAGVGRERGPSRNSAPAYGSFGTPPRPCASGDFH